jgi:hypothetical protein
MARSDARLTQLAPPVKIQRLANRRVAWLVSQLQNNSIEAGGLGCGVRLGSTVKGHKQETSSKQGPPAKQIASKFKLCVKKFLAIASYVVDEPRRDAWRPR